MGKRKEDQVEIWQEKRKGGNRAPKIEPEGTTSWRTRPLEHREREGTLTSLDLDEGDTEIYIPESSAPMRNNARSPLSRWPEYVSEVLDIVDMHLNVLVQCISQGAPKVSFRCLPSETENLLPGIFRRDFENLGKEIMEGLYGLPASALGYLLQREQLFGRMGWCTPNDLEWQLYTLAVAQINNISTTNLLSAKFNEIPPADRNLFLSRQILLAREQREVMKYVILHNSPNINHSLLGPEMVQLVDDCANGHIAEEYLPIWNVCLHYHWLGKLNALPNYPALLEAAGFAKRIPLQLRHPAESAEVHEKIGAWLEKMKLERQRALWDLSFEFLCGGPSATPEWSEQARKESQANEFGIDWAGNLSLNRNWQNQFSL
jgi:hypothetical protein